MEIAVDQDGNCSFVQDLSEWAREFHGSRNFRVNCAGNGLFRRPTWSPVSCQLDYTAFRPPRFIIRQVFILMLLKNQILLINSIFFG